jgi:AraC-like DNA-binding protein
MSLIGPRLRLEALQQVVSFLGYTGCQRALGVSPKWLIRCFRLQDALARLGVGSDVNLSALAQVFGYFDQAHFTRDFKRVTGVSPGRY